MELYYLTIIFIGFWHDSFTKDKIEDIVSLTQFASKTGRL